MRPDPAFDFISTAMTVARERYGVHAALSVWLTVLMETLCETAGKQAAATALRSAADRLEALSDV